LPSWGENEVCDARQAVKLPCITAFESEAQRLHLPISCAFRRLYADGLALVKYELGFSVSRSGAGRTGVKLDDVSLTKLLVKLLQMEAVLPLLEGKTKTTLSNIQSHLPKLYLQSTTKTTFLQEGVPPEWWIFGVRPLVLIEAEPKDSLGLPRRARRISVEPYMLLGCFQLRVQGTVWPVWVIKHTVEGGEWDLRMLRLQLLRLNAENQCLLGVLRVLDKRKDDILLKRGTTASELLQRFFRDSLRRISRTSNRAHKIIGGDFEQLARTSIDALKPGDRKALLKYLRLIGIRYNIYRNVESYTESGGIVVKETHIHADQGQVTVIGKLVANKIENSFNQAMQAPVNDALKNELRQLRQLLSGLLKKLPKDQADTVARDFSDLTEEATSKKPRKVRLEVTGKGLIEAAKACAEFVAPITKTVKAIISLCAL